MTNETKDTPAIPRRVVCGVCGDGPLNGVPLFIAAGNRYCPECIPVGEARRRLDRQQGPLLDRDVVEIFTRRLASQ
jgi:hypothetical protein